MAGTRKSRASRKRRVGNVGTAKRGKLNPDQGLCTSCKKGQKFAPGAKIVTIKNGRKMMKGNCIECNGKMNKFVAG